MKITYSSIQAALARLGFAFFSSGAYNLNIVGIRSLDTTPDKFNDFITVSYLDEAGNKICRIYPATTDPGLYYLKNPMRLDGTAILIAPQQVRGGYQIGLHNGKYKALRQIKPVKFVRDNDRDSHLDYYDSAKHPESLVQEAVIYANIHRAHAEKTVAIVDRFSAACQVIHQPNHFDEFMALVERSAAIYGDKFTYTLIREDSL